MKFTAKIVLLSVLTIVAIVITFLLPPIGQDPSYHLFADNKSFLGVFNFWNVITNIPFVVIGVYGLCILNKSTAKKSIILIYCVLFIGIMLIGPGSAYYHYSPDNYRLVYDRIPMTIVFMAFLSAVVAECINARIGTLLLFPLIIIGITSVLWWHYTELTGHGDLRIYGLVQFYPMIATPVIMISFPSAANNNDWRILMWVVLWYAIAKIFEHFDTAIYSITNFISGHSLKHIMAAMATWYMVKLFANKYQVKVK